MLGFSTLCFLAYYMFVCVCFFLIKLDTFFSTSTVPHFLSQLSVLIFFTVSHCVMWILHAFSPFLLKREMKGSWIQLKLRYGLCCNLCVSLVESIYMINADKTYKLGWSLPLSVDLTVNCTVVSLLARTNVLHVIRF